MPLARHGSRTIDWQRRGAGAPLLLVQGMAGHHRLWGEPLLRDLERDFEVITFDHRGIGASDDPDRGEYGIADLAEDVVAVLDAAGHESAHVLGISMGGMVAQEFVLSHPERVRTLAIGCSYCGGPGSSLAAPGPLRMMQAMEAATRTGNIDAGLRVAFEVNVSPSFAEGDDNFARFREISLSVRVPVPVVLQQAKAAFVHDTSARLPGVTVPTLVLHGTADQMLGHENGPLIAKLIPGATLHTFEDVGHLFWLEEPAVTAQLLREHCLRQAQ